MTEPPRFEGDAWCFGCGPSNTSGLNLEFRVTGAGVVECQYTVPAHLCGRPTVVHGGIQATLLDEVMGKAVQIGLPSELGGRRCVTASLALRYRKPAAIGQLLTARGEFLRIEGPNVFVGGTLFDNAGGVLTTAEARWRMLDDMR